MALSIYNNIPSMNSQNQLRVNNNKLGESLERLSSGMRINRASDDASGLAISEKMRGQISGLGKAISNAQDGISLIQTAEGALNETTAILQRMRELSVQAANGTYTSNDRREIQREVDQLKDEIDRISTSTEFNTKKLLNGDSAARWSTSDSDKMEAIVRDSVVSGNYKIDVMAKVGQNQVQKSNIMSLKEGAIAGDILTTGNVVSGGTGVPTNYANSSGITGMVSAEGVRTGDMDDRTYRINIGATSAAGASESISISMGATAGVMGTYIQEGSNWSVNGTRVDGDDSQILTSIDVLTGVNGYLEVEFVSDVAVYSGGAAPSTISDALRVRFIDVKTGQPGDWATLDMDDDGTIDIDGSISGFTRTGGKVTDIIATASEINISTGDVKSGDKLLLSLNSHVPSDEILASIGAGAFKIDERFDDGAIGQARELRGAYYVETAASGLQNTMLSDGAKDLTYNLAQLDEKTGSVTIGNIVLQTAANQNGTQPDEEALLEVRGTGGLASVHTKLSDIEAFNTPDGTNVFDVSRKISLYGNGKNVDVYLEADDTIGDLETKLQKAITDSDGLGITMGSSTTDSHVTDFISKGSAVANTHGALEGTMLMRSLFNGAQGEINLVADQPVIDALNLQEIQAAEENVYEVEVSDAHNGRPMGSDVVGDGRMEGVIKGAEVVFKGNIGVNSEWNETDLKFDFSSETEATSMYMHLVDNSIDFQIGANEGQTMNTAIGQVDVKSLNLENITVITQDAAQRAITNVDKALTDVTSMRAALGAVSNRLDHTINSLSVAEENLQASESRIRDTDVAAEMSKFTSNQMLSQAAQSMLAQANQLPQGLMQLLQG